MNDHAYLKRVICRPASKTLSHKESEVLYWAANGKSSYEIALILGRCQSTVEEQKKSIRKKLNVANMAQAVFEGVKLGYIGAFSQGWEMKEAIYSARDQPLSNMTKVTSLELINSIALRR